VAKFKEILPMVAEFDNNTEAAGSTMISSGEHSEHNGERRTVVWR